MNSSKKIWLSLFLASAMTLSPSFCAFAENGVGPAFDPRYNSDIEGTSESSEADSTSTAIEAGTEAATETDNETVTEADNNTQAGSDAGSGQAAPEETPAPETEAPAPAAVSPQPRLQTTILLSSQHWSQPFVNDQWCDAGDETFYSISIFMEQAIGNLYYRAYTASNGWTNWAMNGQQSGIPADMAPIEAIQIRFDGPVLDEYDLFYSAILKDGTATGWAKNGMTAGSMNQGNPIKAFRMAFFRKADPSDITVGDAVVSAHADGIQYIDGALRYIHGGDGSNFTGWGWDESQRYYFVDSVPVTGWQYIDGYKYYFAEDGKLVEDLEPIIGAQGPYLIKINKEMNTATIYVADGENGFIIPLKSFLCSCGDDTPVGTFKTPEKYRWRLMNSGVSCQYATRLGPGLSFLLHSIIYDRQDINTLWPETYNYLGVARSAGCIRFTSGDAKWIFDHCPLGTTIQVYNSPIAGPYDRPTIQSVIPSTQRWDPTDPLAVAQFGQQ
ncbi:L,D-transpeptidase [Clostridiaceae bacterium]|nr:L,D-transpeptidase [Clostridiaceae bacterium]RKI10783.1 L,D-transpeptidase [bacterium 1XD21-70]